MKLKMIFAVALVACVFHGNLQANYVIHGDVQISYLHPLPAEAIWSREKEVTPKYPLELARKGIVGCGVFNVSIDEKGKTTDISLVRSVPERVLSRPVAKEIRKWKWVNSSGAANAPEQKLIRLDFCMGGSTTEEAEARCKVQATAACQV